VESAALTRRLCRHHVRRWVIVLTRASLSSGVRRRMTKLRSAFLMVNGSIQDLLDDEAEVLAPAL